jgi:ribosomal protein S18 acetylase RimI-like enzyme
VQRPPASGSIVPRRAELTDVPQLARALARAFFDDPVAEWTCRPERLRPAMLERFQATRLRQLVTRGEVWTTDDLQCAALWARPGAWKTTLAEDLALGGCLTHPRLLPRLPLIAGGLYFGLEREHPHDPEHWYLGVLGTAPEAQGRGLASSVLAPVLEECDRDGVGAYLESSKERNIDFYARHGFHVTAVLRLARGPKLWAMWRDPRP